ncbi:MAG: VWA domain-containing protein [Planctomycetes bacterium]|nr:VWA domain-containing protein [Planctomycetota bacterium]
MRSTLIRVLACASLLGASPAFGQGVYIDRRAPLQGPSALQAERMALTRHQVLAEVAESMANYRIEQTFRNLTDQTIEGTYLFPVPRDAVATGLSLTINGKEVAGEVLDSGQAGTIYRDIVRKMRDPALLEFAEQGLLRASIFPIEPRAEVKIAIQFAAPAERVGDLYALALPLKFAAGSDADLTVDVRLKSALPLTTIYSPTHAVDVAREGERAARVTFEGKPKGRADFLLYFARSESEVGMSLLAHRLPAQDGTFVLMLAPALSLKPEERQPRDVVFVLDRSGSMAGEKWDQAVAALKYGLRTLRPEDRFALVSFATDVRAYKPGLTPAAAEEIEGAAAHLEMLRPAGGTNIAESLAQALSCLAGDSPRLRLVAFLTDGLPTIGEIEPAKILEQASRANGGRARLFAFGVGYDVNTFLLDRLAEDSRGASDYIGEGENIEVCVSAFFAKVAEPVLVAPVLEFQGVETWDIYPQKLPDLFAGSALLVAGRYRGEGSHAITLRGTSARGEKSLTVEGSFPRENRDCAFLAPVWAARKVGFLLNEIRLHGANKELVDAVIALGKEHGIVTPYTSALVVEEGERLAGAAGFFTGMGRRTGGPPAAGAAEAKARDDLERLGYTGGDAGAATGRESVALARKLGELADAASADEVLSLAADRGLALERVTAAGRTLLRIGGFHVDTAFTEALKPGLVEVEAFSDEYFKLLDGHPELRELFALGTDLIFVLEGRAIRVK